MNPPNHSSQRELVCGLGQYKSYVVFIDTIMDFSRRALESDRTRRRGAHEYTSCERSNYKDILTLIAQGLRELVEVGCPYLSDLRGIR
jgi:hypothetical protein